ncbi:MULTISPECIES: helix-turn-helix domain-containing protein [Bradyrhizobium]|uniref:Transposase n=1 Tax=Bradyrhizobium quebecense TaxID=2748629 RepID=A0A939RPU9_9BRAD|nr:helix-turn-helix domain-containing protein [Bradyrhizobium quebecense]
MGRAYSDDLRERVVRAVIKGGLSRHQAAAQFGVAISTAINWVQRFHETGSVKPDQIGGYRPKKIAGPHREMAGKQSDRAPPRIVHTGHHETVAKCEAEQIEGLPPEQKTDARVGR